jgi:hypothetical protein
MQRKGPKPRDPATGRSLNLDGQPRKVQVRAPIARDAFGRALRKDGKPYKVKTPSGVHHWNYGKRWKNPPGKGMRAGGKPGRGRRLTISERLLKGFGRVLTPKRAADMARADPFRAADLAVRIEQAPVLRELQTPPAQYFLDFGTPPLEGEAVRVPESEQLERPT